MGWYQHDFVFDTIATAAGLLVIAPLLVSQRTRRWARRMLDGDIEIVGIAVLLLAIIGFAIYNHLAGR